MTGEISLMPTIYQARCERCGYLSDLFPSEYGAVFVDEPTAESSSLVLGAALHSDVGGATFARQGDPRFVVLAHPLEAHFLAEAGYTWASLTRAGRYVRVRVVGCVGCGAMYEVRRLACPPGFGCLVGCVVGLAVAFWVAIKAENWLAGLIGAWMCAMGIWLSTTLVGEVYTRVRFRKRARELDGPRSCPRCESAERVGANTKRTLPCLACGHPAMHIHPVGMS